MQLLLSAYIYLAHEKPMLSQKSTDHKDQNIQSNMQVPQTVKPVKSRNRVIGGSVASKLAEDYETKIEKGQQTRHTFPWMVRITSARICDDGKKVGYCGGSLISKRLIASAYHCTQHTSPTALNKVRSFVSCSIFIYNCNSKERGLWSQQPGKDGNNGHSYCQTRGGG